MKLLILGGTKFVGRHLVEAAQARGHVVTLFHRGQTNPDLFPDIEHLHGNRDGQLDALKGRTWDAAIDTCGYVPRVVKQSVTLLADAVAHYTFISSISAYADFRTPQQDETAPGGITETPETEEVTNASYGPLKILCEQEVEAAFPNRALQIRPGLIVGPFDPSDRFTYWPVRVAQGGDILVPGETEAPLQFIDCRDLAEWTIRMVEAKKAGIYNAVGPNQPLAMQNFLALCRLVSQSVARFFYVDGAFLQAQEVSPESVNSFYLDPNEADFAQIWNVSNAKAVADGLTFRPVETTIQDTLDWNAARPAETKLRVGLEPERERELLQAWKVQTSHE